MPDLECTQLSLAEEAYASFKARLPSCSWFLSPDTSLFVLAHGSLPKIVVTSLAHNSEIELVWDGSSVPWWAFPLRFIAASHGGICMISGPVGLNRAIESLLSQAYVEFLLVQKPGEASVRNRLVHDGVRASARALAIAGCEEVLATICIDDDAIDSYPVHHYYREGWKNPLIAEYELA